MLAMEEILCEVGDHEKRNAQGLPPGFRFHPTDEELITFYLASKVFNATFTHVKFVEVDLNRCEPWELPEVAKMGEREWYLFSLRDRKYPTGLRTNRATGAGYWKATGKDKEVFSATCGSLLGMKKTLVFYKGRAPRGHKTKWVMHEYRLDPHLSHSSKEEWVICRIFHKSGEKRSPQLLQVQGSSLPHQHQQHPTTPSFQPQKQQQQQNDMVFPSLFQPHFPIPPHAAEFTNTRTRNHLLFKVKEQQQSTNLNPKPTKTEPNLFQYQILDHAPDNLSWMDKLNTNPSTSSNNLALEMDAAAMIAANADMPSSSASSIAASFNRTSLHHILLDSPIGMESWPLPQHV